MKIATSPGVYSTIDFKTGWITNIYKLKIFVKASEKISSMLSKKVEMLVTNKKNTSCSVIFSILLLDLLTWPCFIFQNCFKITELPSETNIQFMLEMIQDYGDLLWEIVPFDLARGNRSHSYRFH